MIIDHKYKDQVVGVLGFGKTGISMIQSLLASGAKVIAYDDYECKGMSGGTKSLEGEPSQNIAKECLLTVTHPNLIVAPIELEMISSLAISPGIDSSKHDLVQRAIKASIPIISDMDMLYEACPLAFYITITGTNGKSTTTNLINHIICGIISIDEQRPNFRPHRHERCKFTSVQMGGNIGTASLSLQVVNRTDSAYVLEMSSYQIDLLLSMKSSIAICLNITPDHLDRYQNMDRYSTSKSQLFDRCDHAIISVDHPHCLQIYEGLKRKQSQMNDVQPKASQPVIIPFSVKKRLLYGVSLIDGILNISLDDYMKEKTNSEIRIHIENLDITGFIPGSLLGKHNAENIASAIAVSLLCGCKLDDTLQQIKSYQALPHRMEIIQTLDQLNAVGLNGDTEACRGIIWVNDSKATNTESTRYALNAFSNIHWIMGGLAKEDSVLALKDDLQNVLCTYLIGSSTDKFAEHCKEISLAGSGMKYEICCTLEEAINRIKNKIQSGNIRPNATILLSPACASLDQWKNFEERGEYFAKIVRKISREEDRLQ